MATMFASSGTGTSSTVMLPVGATYYAASQYIVVNATSTAVTGLSIDDGITIDHRNLKDYRPGYGEEICLSLQDGGKFILDASGNYRIEDKDAKITYKANTSREFNRFINASDLLAKFITDMGELGAKQDNVLQIPIEQFITWLIVQAAKQDGEDMAPDLPRLAAHAGDAKPRCRSCGRFIPRRHMTAGLLFCGGAHADRYLGATA